MSHDLLKSRSHLYIAGLGVIAFSAWSIIKVTLVFLLDENLLAGIYPGWGDLPSYAKIAIFCLAMFFLIVDLVFRLIIGINARRESMGINCGIIYVILAFGAAFTSAASTISSAISLMSETTGVVILDDIASLIVDCTSLFTICELIVCSLKVKKLSGKEAQTGAA